MTMSIAGEAYDLSYDPESGFEYASDSGEGLGRVWVFLGRAWLRPVRVLLPIPLTIVMWGSFWGG